MEKFELRKIALKLGYSLEQAELDYYQHFALGKIFQKFNTIYFKGGTCLQKCYGVKRFSEDLDFNYVDLEEEEIKEFLSNLFDSEIFDYSKTRFGFSFSVKFKGILYTGIKNSMCKLSFDFRKNDFYGKPLKRIINPIYDDLEDYFLLALNKKEILAEKTRAIITRYKARDIYDLNKLLSIGVEIDFNLINKKLNSYDKSFDFEEFKNKVSEKESIYEEEMKRLVKIYPSFDECKKNIIKKFNQFN